MCMGIVAGRHGPQSKGLLSACSPLFSIKTTGDVACLECRFGIPICCSGEFTIIKTGDQSRWIKDLSLVGFEDMQTLMTKSCQQRLVIDWSR